MNSTHVADYIQQKLADDIKQHQLMLKEKPASIDDAEDQFMRHGEGRHLGTFNVIKQCIVLFRKMWSYNCNF